ncbi:MAG: hypothetical protein KatS3mg009_0501 [Acidimicrobiia bacterium]|nr:MAG: hypothetical protein KatS3mg009_0501 [Acidimicrobiia bacterium]
MPIVLVIGAWHVRNERVLGSSQFSGSQAVTLYCWHAAGVEAAVRGVEHRRGARGLGCHPGGWDDLRTTCPSWWACDADEPLADGASWDEMSRRGVEVLRAHPRESVEVYVRGPRPRGRGPGTDTVRRFLGIGPSPLLAAALFTWNAVVWALASIGAVVGLRSVAPTRRTGRS